MSVITMGVGRHVHFDVSPFLSSVSMSTEFNGAKKFRFGTGVAGWI